MTTPRAPKIQRWIDLIAALLRRHYGITFEQLRHEVPAYGECASDESLQRMFERDKDELRKFGVTIESVPDDDGVPSIYVLRRRDFYLPYLMATSGRTGSIPARPPSRPGATHAGAPRAERDTPASERREPVARERSGYRDLPRLALEPDELSAVADAAQRVRQLGDPRLATDAESALRKLAFDLPIGALVSTAPVKVVPGRARAEARVFEAFDRALRNRKRARFTYRSPDREKAERREVEPYGLFFVGGSWYIVGRDTARGALRNFRLNRVEKVQVNAQREQTADYVIPPGFDLREHAHSRHAWELGDGEAFDAVVAFRVTDGATAAAARLGESLNDGHDTRRFRVRRMPPFVRWLVSLGGDALPLEPPALVESFRACIRETLARYEEPSAEHRPPRIRGRTRAGGRSR